MIDWRFKIGDVVRSREGGPRMVVCDTPKEGDSRYRVRWFDSSLKMQRSLVNPETIEHVLAEHPYRDIAPRCG